MKRCTKCGELKPPRAFYLISRSRPGKRHPQCKYCNLARQRKQVAASRQWIREYAAGWRQKNQLLIESANDFVSQGGGRAVRLAPYYRLRHDAILAYGGYRCACCGADEALFLTIDHVNDGGARHRRQVGSSTDFFHWLKDNGYPAGFQ